MKEWWSGLTKAHKAWIIGATIAVVALGVISGDSAINILIAFSGIAYVAVYTTGVKENFLMGIVYVSLYTVICLKNRIMLDALQNVILIPIYLYSYFYWGNNHVKPFNLKKNEVIKIYAGAAILFVGLYYISKLLHGNYSALDAFNTTCTLIAMLTGAFGMSITWSFWSLNNVASALVFGFALTTPTGSVAVFAMKVIFLINGLIGWYNFYKIGKREENVV